MITKAADCKIGWDNISFKDNFFGETHQLRFFVIDGVSIEAPRNRSDRYSVVIFFKNKKGGGLIIENVGSSQVAAETYKNKIEEAVINYVEKIVTKIGNELVKPLEKVKTTLKENKYLSLNDDLDLPEGYDYFLLHHYLKIERLPVEIQESIKLLSLIYGNKDRLKYEHNKSYFKLTKEKYNYLFTNIEAYPLSDEQITAILTDEDRYLLFLLKVKTPAFQAGSILPAVVL